MLAMSEHETFDPVTGAEALRALRGKVYKAATVDAWTRVKGLKGAD